MTLVFDSEKKCSVCGNPSVQYDIVSTNSFGSPDLDTRPPEMERSTIDYWVQRCPQCGYCSSAIDKKIEGSEKIITEGGYKDILSDKNFSALANSFRAKAYLYERLENNTNSAWAMIHAAWVCDGEKSKDSASQCRLKAFKLIQKVTDNGELMIKQAGGTYALSADLLRRSGMYEQASEVITKGFNSNPADIILQLLKVEKLLVENKNDLCYTMEDASKLIKDGLQSHNSDLPF